MGRKLTRKEIREARTVFSSALIYAQVRIHENVLWPDWIDNIGRIIKRMPSRDPKIHNAISIGDHCCFPETLSPPKRLDIAEREVYSAWLIHELCHCWQFQRFGWIYLIQAIKAQFQLGSDVYDFGNCAVLQEKAEAGWSFSDFNREQQAALLQRFYGCKKAEKCLHADSIDEVGGCLTFVAEIQHVTRFKLEGLLIKMKSNFRE